MTGSVIGIVTEKSGSGSVKKKTRSETVRERDDESGSVVTGKRKTVGAGTVTETESVNSHAETETPTVLCAGRAQRAAVTVGQVEAVNCGPGWEAPALGDGDTPSVML